MFGNIPEDFNTNIYKLLNNDLIHLNDEELINHYLIHSINEKRLYKKNIPEDFNVNNYKVLNCDLNNLNDEELIKHYLNHGFNEGRLYKKNIPEDFNVNNYRYFNEDLYNFNDEELIEHYLLHGIYEIRPYKFSLPKNLINNIKLNYLDTKININKIKNSNNLLNTNYNDAYSNTVYFIGGICNMLFQICTLISLSHNNNMKFYLNYDKDERKYDVNKLFKNINYQNNISNYKYNESSYKYNDIIIDINQNILFKGYFQSYKYFWENNNIIKNYFNFDDKLLFWMKYKNYIFDTESKKLLGIHIRLTDYVKSSDTHINMTDDYYRKALSNINLSEYKIILFSDDTIKASNILNNIEIYNFTCANDIDTDDLEQLLLLSVTDIRICVNSTYSLWSCYINDMYELDDNAIYIFPNLWFGPKGPEYDLYDLIPENNNKYKIINVYKCAVIFFHKNIYNIYNKYWIDKCRDSIINQMNVFYDIYEINYGNDDKSIFDNYNFPKNINKYFYKKNYKTHTEAMMFLLNKCFFDNNYDIVFNTNLDDYYNNRRFIYQIYEVNKNNSLLNSTMWTYIKQKSDYEDFDVILNDINKIIYDTDFKWIKDYNIEDYQYGNNIIDANIVKNNILSSNNLINHSGVCFTKKFWDSTDKYNNRLKYRNDKPYEDLSLWYRAFENNINITIINQNLIYYRIHGSQIGSQLKEIQKSGVNKETFNDGPNLIDYQIGILLDINFKDIQKINNLNENIFPDKEKYYFLYINEDDESNIKEYLKDLNISYNIVCYNNKLENYKDIIKLFDVSLELNSDYLIIIKDLNINFVIDTFNIENNTYDILKI